MKITLPKISFKELAWKEASRTRALIIVSMLAAIYLAYGLQIFQRFELVTYDYRCMMRGSRPAQPQIVVIEISDDSVAKIGRWPWERNWHASLIKILKKLGAKAVVFDVIFSEQSDPVNDASLAGAIQAAKNVYLAEVVEEIPSLNKSRLLTSLPEFRDNAAGAGHINLAPDEDGVMRRMPLTMNVDGKVIPQLSLAVVLDLFGSKAEDIVFKKEEVIIPAREKFLTVPLDAKGNFILNWTGRWDQTFKHYSYIDVISSYAVAQKGQKPLIALEEFKDKICFVGTSASGLFDIRPTPLQPAYPAVGVNLTVLNNLLEEKFIRPFSFFENAMILLFLAFGIYFITSAESYFRNAFRTLLLAVAYWAVCIALFVFFGWWINLIYPTIFILVSYFGLTLYNQLAVTIERAKLMKMATRDSLTGLYNIGQFKLLAKAELATLVLRRNDRNMSILMSDADNFKKTNDTYGHPTGDAVLRELSAIIKGTCRALDVAARYGGEEFIVMLPGASEQDAAKVADKIRLGLSQKVFKHEKGDFSTTISIGVTQARPGDIDIEVLVARADKALYEAKHTGKNKVVIYQDSFATQPTPAPPK